MNQFYKLYEQSQDVTMEQVREYAAKTGEEIRRQITRKRQPERCQFIWYMTGCFA